MWKISRLSRSYKAEIENIIHFSLFILFFKWYRHAVYEVQMRLGKIIVKLKEEEEEDWGHNSTKSKKSYNVEDQEERAENDKRNKNNKNNNKESKTNNYDDKLNDKDSKRNKKNKKRRARTTKRMKRKKLSCRIVKSFELSHKRRVCLRYIKHTILTFSDDQDIKP